MQQNTLTTNKNKTDLWYWYEIISQTFKKQNEKENIKHTSICMKIINMLIYMCVCVCMLSHVWLFGTPWTVPWDFSSVHEISQERLLCPWNFQARILQWVAISFSFIYVCLLPISRNARRKLSIGVFSEVKKHTRRDQGWEENAPLILHFFITFSLYHMLSQLCTKLKT